MTTTIQLNSAKTTIDTLLEHPEYLSDVQLLALFLSGRGNSTPEDKARALLQWKSLIELLRTPYSKEHRAFGISKRQLSQIQAGLELARRSVAATLDRDTALTTTSEVRAYLQLHMTGLHDEQFCVLYLSNRHMPIAFKTLSYGTIDSAAVYPRNVIKSCMATNASAVIFAHNHPSGVAEPSDTDIRLTRKLTDALALIDVRVLDHLIIGQGVQTSLAERGLM